MLKLKGLIDYQKESDIPLLLAIIDGQEFNYYLVEEFCIEKEKEITKHVNF